MNTRAAIVMLLLALAIGGGAFFALRPRPEAAPEQRTWLAQLDPATIDTITIRWNDNQQALLEKTAMTDLWLLRQGSSAWPVSARRVGAMATLLRDVDSAPATEKGATDGATVTFRTGSTDRTMSISSGVLGGRAIVRVHGEPDVYRSVDAQIARLFEKDGVRAWREAAAFNTGDFSRIRLQTIGRQIILARNAGRWGMQVPVAAPADQERCQQLAGQLPRITLSRFIDQPPGNDDALGLAAPEALIDTETDFRTVVNGDVQRRTLLQQLKVGGPVDPSGKLHYASLRAEWLDPATRSVTPAWGPVLAAIPRESLDALSAESTQYLSRLSVQTAAADVARLTIYRDDNALKDERPPAAVPDRSVQIERYLEEWRIRPPGSILRGPSPTESAGIEYLLRTLCELPAEAIGREAPQGTTVVARLKVDATGAGEDIGVGIASVSPPADKGTPRPDPKPALVLRVGGIYRVYFQQPALDAARWIADALPPEG
ncbi:MAG TPA: hypothetical protein VD997_00625 [Phycisphaerales bacterium]|nr:hypothetical protein [Phycisphaerales bacterium]